MTKVDSYHHSRFVLNRQYWELLTEAYVTDAYLEDILNPAYLHPARLVIDIGVPGWLVEFSNYKIDQTREFVITNYYEYLEYQLDVDLSAQECKGIQGISIQSYLADSKPLVEIPHAQTIGLALTLRLNNIRKVDNADADCSKRHFANSALEYGFRVFGSNSFPGLSNPVLLDRRSNGLEKFFPHLQELSVEELREENVYVSNVRGLGDEVNFRFMGQDRKLPWVKFYPEILEHYPFDPMQHDRVCDFLSTGIIDRWLQHEYGIEWLKPSTYTGRAALFVARNPDQSVHRDYHSSPLSIEEIRKYKNIDIDHIYQLMEQGLF